MILISFITKLRSEAFKALKRSNFDTTRAEMILPSIKDQKDRTIRAGSRVHIAPK